MKKMKLLCKLGSVMFITACVVLMLYHLQPTSWELSGWGVAGLETEGEGGDTALDALEEKSSTCQACSLHQQEKLLVLHRSFVLDELAALPGPESATSDAPRALEARASTDAAATPWRQSFHSASAANNTQQQESRGEDSLSAAPLYIITPTYRRPEQIAELTRMAQTLMHVRNMFWLVIEDSKKATRLVTALLNRTGIPYQHLIAPMPKKYKKRKGNLPRGVSNRNRGLAWLRANATTGVFYFADDDNTYDIQLFEEMRTTKKVSMWPVGLVTNFGLSTPVVAKGKFKGFYDGWVFNRKFPVDMAGFAVSVEFLLKRPKASMPYMSGLEENGFLKSLAPFEPREIELKAQNCTKILVWHTQTKKNPPAPRINLIKYKNTNLVQLKQQIV